MWGGDIGACAKSAISLSKAESGNSRISARAALSLFGTFNAEATVHQYDFSPKSLRTIALTAKITRFIVQKLWSPLASMVPNANALNSLASAKKEYG
jgi:hypothetical protein